MTLTFGYFQYYPDMIFIMLPAFLSEIVHLLLNIMICRSGRAEQEMQKQKILVSISIINILFALLSFAIPSVIGLPSTEIEIIIYRLYVLLVGLFVRFPFFITYGIKMYWFGKMNRDSLSKNYLISARILLVCNSFFVINFTLAYLFALTSTPLAFVDIHGVLRIVFLLGYFAGWVFLALHGKVAENVNFVYAGILGCLWSFLCGYVTQLLY